MKLFSNTINTLENGLNYASLNQKVISQNIANADTANYKAKEVEFKTFFDQSLQQFDAKRTNQRHFSFRSDSQHPSVKTKSAFQYNHNGNGVDMDQEMSEMATNQIYFNALTDRINGKFNSLQSVIRGGK
ncbi:flagellar basal body rod protein FlgB [Rossellomorea sp. YZS02]|uniref:flagellar basal body rod protein FlgB n=1 Tax=Rossellomorea sp. YZS02 TaxID=3097358 RepID=UPI002A112C65|nr:flagellar basal body rod protein FlgB [Rossellomorea sp. YZS02]MDX8343880.1 flagellar basal body rod protein FlgB [Rossellomorea sp. YZS02]